ncbi:CPBP family intramembrane glutamic endopeptidase [Actinoplanes sp. NPDC051861]|uniref:CPBP family intramembrane glutamic endopeptidase n=1 Tax=Actinoplanes sp. NPDC051861 TaxID=3155170 RepID=UPI003423CD55
MTRARVNFVLFAAAAIGAGWLGLALDRFTGEDGSNGVAFSESQGTLGQLVFILGPAIAALGLYLLSRDGAGRLGLTLRFASRTKWFALTAAFYPAVSLVAVGSGVAAGAVAWSAEPATGRPTLIAATISVLAVQLIKNPIEEFIFRGYGTRTAAALGLPGRLTPHLLAGAVWAAWHLPLYLVWTSASDMRLVTSLPTALFLPLLFAGLMVAAVLYGEVRMRTGSIWPGVVMHTRRQRGHHAAAAQRARDVHGAQRRDLLTGAVGGHRDGADRNCRSGPHLRCPKFTQPMVAHRLTSD